MKQRFGFAGVLLCLLLVPVQVRAYGLDTKLIHLGSGNMGLNSTLIPASVSPGPKFFRLAFVLKRQDLLQQVCVDGRVERPYKGIAKNMPIFSPDGRYYVYLARLASGQSVLVLNGRQGPPYDGISRPMFSPDSSKIVYVAQQGTKQFVVINGQPQPAYEGIALKESPVISPDSKHIAYVALKNKKTVLVLDGQESAPFSLVLEPRFSPDSQKLSYIVVWDKGKWQPFVNGKPAGEIHTRISQLTFSPDSEHLAYVAQQGPSGPGQKQFLVLDGQPQASYDLVTSPIFSPDSRHLAYVAVKNRKMALVKDGQPGRFYSQVGAFMFSPDSTLFVYMAAKGKKSVIVTCDQGSNPRELGPYDSVGLPVISPDSKHLAFRARKGKEWFLVLDGKPGMTFSLVRRPWFSPDSSRLAYQAFACKALGALDKKWHMVVRGVGGREEPGPGYGLLERPFFSPDSKHLAYVAGRPTQARVVFDGVESKETFTGFLKGVPLVFDRPARLHTLALREPGPEFFRVECELHPRGKK